MFSIRLIVCVIALLLPTLATELAAAGKAPANKGKGPLQRINIQLFIDGFDAAMSKMPQDQRSIIDQFLSSVKQDPVTNYDEAFIQAGTDIDRVADVAIQQNLSKVLLDIDDMRTKDEEAFKAFIDSRGRVGASVSKVSLPKRARLPAGVTFGSITTISEEGELGEEPLSTEEMVSFTTEEAELPQLEEEKSAGAAKESLVKTKNKTKTRSGTALGGVGIRVKKLREKLRLKSEGTEEEARKTEFRIPEKYEEDKAKKVRQLRTAKAKIESKDTGKIIYTFINAVGNNPADQDLYKTALAEATASLSVLGEQDPAYNPINDVLQQIRTTHDTDLEAFNAFITDQLSSPSSSSSGRGSR
jgi:hypothetical protein